MARYVVPRPLDEKAHGMACRVERLFMGERVSAVESVVSAAARRGGDRRDRKTSSAGSLGAAAAAN